MTDTTRDDAATAAIETQVALLLRRSDSAHRRSPELERALERSAYLALRRLADGGPTSISALADQLLLDASTVTRQVLAMQQAGYVDRAVDAHDARRAIVSATPAGLAALEATQDARARFYGRILDGWSATDRTRLATLLRRLNDAFDANNRRPPD